MADTIYVNAYKGGDNPKAPKVKGTIFGKDLARLAQTFPEGCQFAIFKNQDAGQTKNIKGKEIKISDFTIKFSEPYKKSGNVSGNNQSRNDDVDF